MFNLIDEKKIKIQSQLCKQVDLQALREIFLYEIATYKNSKVQSTSSEVISSKSRKLETTASNSCCFTLPLLEMEL